MWKDAAVVKAVASASEHVAMMVKAARMYHEQELGQGEIAEKLNVSQSRISRWLKEAARQGIVRTVVVPPEGVFSDLEDAIAQKYGLRAVIVVDPAGSDESTVIKALGSAAASYLEVALTGNNRLGLSSWSSTLLATVDAMTSKTGKTALEVVQVIGGVGHPSVQVKATHLTGRLAKVTGAEPLYLPAPGVVSSRAGWEALVQDPFVAEVVQEWAHLDTLLVGIGSIEPSPLLRESGNSLTEEELKRLAKAGAVGDVCLRFFDAAGNLIEGELNERILGIAPGQLLAVDRRIGVAGGARKFEAIRAAVTGGWINVLITDAETAFRLESA